MGLKKPWLSSDNQIYSAVLISFALAAFIAWVTIQIAYQ